MKILNNIKDLNKAISRIYNLGFVPTMGGLHEGHISLIKNSKRKCDITLVSIYVNPKQFNSVNDYNNYPRSLSGDIKILKKLNVDYLFIPKTKDIYKNKNIKITLKNTEKILCAKFRKGHFEGVLSVMNRLIKIINPKYVFLGEKDFQQFFLIRRYFKNKYDKCTFFLCKTIRSKKMVALSTRNLLLTKIQLKKANYIAKFLLNYKAEIKKNKNKITNISKIKKILTDKLGVKFDYLEIRNEKDLSLKIGKNSFKIFIAYYIANIRLIDNF